MKITIKNTSEEAAAYLADVISARIASKPHFTLVVAGGSTFRRTYELLAERSIDWSGMDIYFGDERCVPPDDERSNYKMIAELLPRHVKIHRIQGEAEPAKAAEQYAAELPDHFDLVLLGVGTDGHTASLFPGTFEEAGDKRVIVTEPGLPPLVPRVSLTFKTLNQTDQIIVAVTGTEKREIAEKLVENGAAGYPISHIRQDITELVIAV